MPRTFRYVIRNVSLQGPMRIRKQPLDFVTTKAVERIARKGFFEGALTGKDIQLLSQAVLTAIATKASRKNIAAPEA